MLREPGVWLVVVECFRPLVHLVQPLVQTFCWLVKDRLLLLLLVKCERRPGWWKQASVDGLRPVSLQMLCSKIFLKISILVFVKVFRIWIIITVAVD